jgi:hypothetical protein
MCMFVSCLVKFVEILYTKTHNLMKFIDETFQTHLFAQVQLLYLCGYNFNVHKSSECVRIWL